MNGILNKIGKKLFNKTLGIHWGTGEVTTIKKSFIKDVLINTVTVLENGRAYFHSNIKIITADDKMLEVNTHQVFVRYMPDNPQILGADKYTKFLKRFIISPFYNYDLENIHNTFFNK